MPLYNIPAATAIVTDIDESEPGRLTVTCEIHHILNPEPLAVGDKITLTWRGAGAGEPSEDDTT